MDQLSLNLSDRPWPRNNNKIPPCMMWTNHISSTSNHFLCIIYNNLIIFFSSLEPRANLQFSFWLYPPNLNHVWIRKNHFFRFIQNMSIFLNLFRRNSVPASQNLLSNQRQDDESSQSESEFKIRVKVSLFWAMNRVSSLENFYIQKFLGTLHRSNFKNIHSIRKRKIQWNSLLKNPFFNFN